jgi:hypothetical protein
MEEELEDFLREREEKRSVGGRVLFLAGAGLCFLLGIVFWLVPVVTGVPFYILGLILLAGASERVRNLLNRGERRFPRRFRLKLREWMHKHAPGHRKAEHRPPADGTGRGDVPSGKLER